MKHAMEFVKSIEDMQSLIDNHDVHVKGMAEANMNKKLQIK